MVLTATVTAACLAITLAALPLLVAAAAVLRGCANIERGRQRRMLPEPVPGGYREVTKPGIVAEVRTPLSRGASDTRLPRRTAAQCAARAQGPIT